MQGKRRTVGGELSPFRGIELQRQPDHVTIKRDRSLHVADEDDGIAHSHGGSVCELARILLAISLEESCATISRTSRASAIANRSAKSSRSEWSFHRRGPMRRRSSRTRPGARAKNIRKTMRAATL